MAVYFQQALNDFKASPRSLLAALLILIFGLVATLILKGNNAPAATFVLTLVITNSLAQMCIDFFPSASKPVFSAIARVIPILAAIYAYTGLAIK